MKNIIVIGAINVDQIFNLKDFPIIGQTISPISVDYQLGGKAANQAVTLAKMGCSTTLIGKIGSDHNKNYVLDLLTQSKVNCKYIEIAQNFKTGSAIIYVNNKGQNMIVLEPNSNSQLTSEDIIKYSKAILQNDALLTQLEINYDTVFTSLKIAHDNQIATFLNPSPAEHFKKELLKYTDYLILNETEFTHILKIDTKLTANIIKKGILELKKEVKDVILTCGNNGAYYVYNDKLVNIKAHKVNAIDTTCAGDVFLGSFISSFDEKNLEEAIWFANTAASIAVQKKGTFNSIPSLIEIKSKLHKNQS